MARFRYQKYREEYRLDGVIVAIDETPIGVFVELEGDETAIAAAATDGPAGPGYVLASYRTLFVQQREAQGRRRRHGVRRVSALAPSRHAAHGGSSAHGCGR